MKKINIILFYNTMFGMPLSFSAADIPDDFIITTDRRFMRDAVAVVFHLPTLYPPLLSKIGRCLPVIYPVLFRSKRLVRKKGQLWVAWYMECEANYPHMRCPSFMKAFDLTMSHHLDSDIVTPYFDHELGTLLREPVRDKTDPQDVCAFISSSFHSSGRLEYLAALMKYLNVHSYGKVLRNKRLENDIGRSSKMDTISRYKFTLAFENAIAKDYVTEKFYDPLIAGSVPIYLGAPNIEDFTPGDHCYINVVDWDSPESLARYIMAVSQDEKLYQSYFQWRSEPLRPAFERLLKQRKEHPFTSLCGKIKERIL
ncbi:MAG: glycosyltransferase family 10 [Smithella sp.]|nr:glycosyltransferase family 10 [Smithella sp.]